MRYLSHKNVSGFLTKIILPGLILGTLLFTIACQEDSRPEALGPTLVLADNPDFVYQDTSLRVGSTFVIQISGTKGTADLDSFQIFLNEQLLFDSAAFNRFSFSIGFEDTISSEIDTYVFRFVLFDEAGATAEQSLQINTQPNIEIVPCETCTSENEQQILRGSTIQLRLNGFRGGSDLNSLHIKLDETTLLTPPLTADERSNGFIHKDIENIDLEVDIADYDLMAILQDEAANADTATILIEVVEYFQFIGIRLGDVNNEQDAGGFFAMQNARVYDSTEARANAEMVDWVYFTNNNTPTLASIDDAVALSIYENIDHFEVKRSTLFIPVDPNIDFDALSQQNILELDFQNGLSRLENFKIGDLIGFRTEDGLQGILRIDLLAPTQGQSGFVRFDIKYIF